MKKFLKKNNKFLRGVIVGPSGIGNVHLREFIRNGFNNIGILGKKFNKKREIYLIVKNFKVIRIQNLKKINLIKNFRPQVISVCSPFNKHLEHLLELRKYCKNIIIEKPFFWSKNKNNYNHAKKLLNDQSCRLLINFPMVSLASQLLKKEKISHVENFRFNYFTSGKKSYDDIAIDLLPHAISFFLIINKHKLDKFKIISVKKSVSEWRCNVILNNSNCKFLFKQDKNRKESLLTFKLNKDFYIRKQKKINYEYLTTLIKNYRKIIYIKNPMTEYIKKMLNNFQNYSTVKNNNTMTLDTMKLTEQLINFK